jgi:hypothetical protein
MQKLPYWKAEIESNLFIQIFMMYYVRTGDIALVKKGIRKVKKSCKGYPDLMLNIRKHVLSVAPELKSCVRNIDKQRKNG